MLRDKDPDSKHLILAISLKAFGITSLFFSKVCMFGLIMNPGRSPLKATFQASLIGALNVIGHDAAIVGANYAKMHNPKKLGEICGFSGSDIFNIAFDSYRRIPSSTIKGDISQQLGSCQLKYLTKGCILEPLYYKL